MRSTSNLFSYWDLMTALWAGSATLKAVLRAEVLEQSQSNKVALEQQENTHFADRLQQ